MLRPNPLERALARAKATGDLESLLAHVQAAPKHSQPDLWDQAITRLWQRYERDLAARVLVAAAPRSDAKIIQHWLRQVLEIEPEIAQARFDEAFLMAHFKPDVASQCGRCGCK